ncbi:BamA/TamA family outer membrane protein [Flavobacteriaceae bacterium F89]|uniref:BamA/TamA family outer membrane protein n=1 Tax=Cerina litoralis TaxID=2874477 RepID=A0AAE3EUP9_9FLAO|nr:BamA/TamA family outer membrane protein [Cerina litoralis]MCG2460810.1 BamA/TamA family outer membrane protein [Cerina litoralis]
MPDNEILYGGADLELTFRTPIEGESDLKSELKSVIRPEPDSKFMGIYWGLLAHYKAQREKPGFLNKYFDKKIGEEPVYLSDVDLDKTKELLNNRLENRGFFNSVITSSTKKGKNTATADYKVSVNEPYTLETYQLNSDTLSIYKEIEKNLAKTVLKPGSRFDLALLKLERKRIDDDLKSDGYYNFNSDFLIFEADTNRYDKKRFDLYLRLKNDVPKKSTVPYMINSLRVYPNYSLESDEQDKDKDTVSIAGTEFIQKPEFFKPHLLEPFILLKKGDFYNPQKSRLTSNRLSSIGAYRYVNIKFDDIGKDSINDTIRKLDASIYLSPLTKRSLQAELQAYSKSNNFAGPALSLVYNERNLFGGGVIFRATGTIAYEWQVASGTNDTGLSSTQAGLQGDLIFPRLLFPIQLQDKFRYAVPKTKISASWDYLNRSQLYNLISYSTTFGYQWNENRYVYHELNPISISYVNPSNITPEFEQILEDNPYLRSSFEQQFIAGLTYTFTYNELGDSGKKNPIYFSTNLDVAGNLFDLFAQDRNNDGKKSLLGLEYSQYAKADIDFRYYFIPGESQFLIGRLFAGLGLPYGNSSTMPFSQQYFSGGPYSVRAFRIRSLGPGTYKPDSDASESYYDQAGNIRLEANVEYRFPLFSYLKGALFADAGNVWLTQENESLPGGKLTSDFINELGIGVGAGLRLDIQNFVIRVDVATPISAPYLPKGERFDFDLNGTILNFAIGYPF